MYICIYVYMYICIYVYMYICIYVYMYICICAFKYMCINENMKTRPLLNYLCIKSQCWDLLCLVLLDVLFQWPRVGCFCFILMMNIITR